MRMKWESVVCASLIKTTLLWCCSHNDRCVPTQKLSHMLSEEATLTLGKRKLRT